MAAPVAVVRLRPADDGATVLEASGLSGPLRGSHAIDGVDLTLTRANSSLIGPNGAGKTTLVNALSGFQRLTAGRILVGGGRHRLEP